MKIFFGFLFFLLLTGANAQKAPIYQTFPAEDVQLLPGIFFDAQRIDMDYILAMEPDRLLAPFLREAGLQPKAESYTNWENTGLDGHIGGHYVSALAMLYANTRDKEILRRLQYMLDELERCQIANGNGYIGGVPGSKKLWDEIAAGRIRAGGFSLNGAWVPLYNIHKTYSGLRDAWWFAGSKQAKRMLINFSDWMIAVTENLTEQQMQNMLHSEYGGLNEVFADVAEITGDNKYLELAYRFSHHFLLHPLVRQEDRLNGMHANTQIPKVIGFERIAQLGDDEEYRSAAKFFWDNVVNHRSVVIGGNSVREHFHPIDDYSSMMTSEQGPETCNTYNMLKLSKMLYQYEGDGKYLDYYERALYNHILSTQHPEKGGFVYFTPMRPGHYRIYSQPHTSMWCCVGSGIENHAKYNELIYAHQGKSLFVNLFIPSQLNWKSEKVNLTLETRFPEEQNVKLTIGSRARKQFTLHLRYPEWVQAGALEVKVNGKPFVYNAEPGSYVAIDRRWRNGDVVELQLPMKTQEVPLPDGSGYVAFMHGPIVLAAATGTDDMPGMFADDSRGGHVASGPQYPLSEMPVLAGTMSQLADKVRPVAGKPLTFTLSDLIYQEQYKSLRLVPFYTLHETRYMLYWPVQTHESIRAKQEEQARAEVLTQQLNAATLDLVMPGEQQPESDHFIQSESSNAGVHNNRHWRDATGWFSYQLRDPEKQAKLLRLTYFGGDRGRRFRVMINNVEIARVYLDGSRGNHFFSVDYDIPQELVEKSNGVLTVKFEAESGSVAGGIYEVRLMK